MKIKRALLIGLNRLTKEQEIILGHPFYHAGKLWNQANYLVKNKLSKPNYKDLYNKLKGTSIHLDALQSCSAQIFLEELSTDWSDFLKSLKNSEKYKKKGIKIFRSPKYISPKMAHGVVTWDRTGFKIKGSRIRLSIPKQLREHLFEKFGFSTQYLWIDTEYRKLEKLKITNVQIVPYRFYGNVSFKLTVVYEKEIAVTDPCYKLEGITKENKGNGNRINRELFLLSVKGPINADMNGAKNIQRNLKKSYFDFVTRIKRVKRKVIYKLSEGIFKFLLFAGIGAKGGVNTSRAIRGGTICQTILEVSSLRTGWFICGILGIILFCSCSCLGAHISESLFFMGEDTQVLTVASGRPEFPKNAPAIAQVITSKEIEEKGIIRLSDLLSQLPGFYLAQREWGHDLYLRGIPSGALFLYNGVALTSDSTKSVYPLDEELSVSSLKRVEIIRGPASVLWGPDAFAGVINIVPKTGKDINGIEVGFIGNTPYRGRGAYINLGKDFGSWEGFLSLNAYLKEPIDKKVNSLTSEQKIKIDEQRFFDIVYNINFFNVFNISGKFSDFKKPYVMYGTNREFRWEAKKNFPFNLIKLEGKKSFNHTSIRFKAYFNHFYQRQEEMDMKWEQKNNIYYFESCLDRDLFDEHGLFTMGVSTRINRVEDADIQTRGFLPDYLENQDTPFRPLKENASFSTRLDSIFFQYRHHFKKLELWGGIRFDNHSEYRSSFTYNLGFAWFFHKNFYLKAIYGTAYRTPYASQFIGRTNLHPEEIKSLNLEMHYSVFKKFSFVLTPFYNVIHNHINEDPFGGYSKPDDEKIMGLETEFEYIVAQNLKFWINTTFLKVWGDKEIYKTLDYITITPEGEPKPYYSLWEKDYDCGAKVTGNIGIEYNITKRIFSFLRLYYMGRRKFSYLRSSGKKFPSTLLLNLSINIKDPFDFFSKNILPNSLLTISLNNLLDNNYYTPGTFSPIKGSPFEMFIKLKINF
jgi:outer membrane receptor protein involved in Fe transport